MKAVQFAQFGVPADVAELIDLPMPEPGSGEVLIKVEASPINPADLLLLRGQYAERPDLPASAGAEGVGRVVQLGAGVTNLALNDRVLLMTTRNNWREYVVAQADRLFAVPSEVDPMQLAMLKVNPPTAWGMLHDFVSLSEGDWIIQNAANSGVGYSVIVLAKALGLRTANVVRRESLIDPLMGQGADVVLVDGPDLRKQVREATGGAQVKLAFDAIGGTATMRLAQCLAEGGTVVNYGLLSGEPCQIAAYDTVFRDVALRGFWLVRWFTRTPPQEIQAAYGRLIELVAQGTLVVPVEATYPLSEIKAALAHAEREGRDGKVLLVPQ